MQIPITAFADAPVTSTFIGEDGNEYTYNSDGSVTVKVVPENADTAEPDTAGLVHDGQNFTGEYNGLEVEAAGVYSDGSILISLAAENLSVGFYPETAEAEKSKTIEETAAEPDIQDTPSEPLLPADSAEPAPENSAEEDPAADTQDVPDTGNVGECEAADDADIVAGADGAAGQIADGVAGQRKTDDGHGGADDHGGHELVNPLHAAELDESGKDHIDQSGAAGADDQTHITGFQRNGAGKGGGHGAQEREGAAEEHGGAELGEEQVGQRAHAGAEKGGGLRHAVADDGGHGDGGGDDGKQHIGSFLVCHIYLLLGRIRSRISRCVRC